MLSNPAKLSTRRCPPLNFHPTATVSPTIESVTVVLIQPGCDEPTHRRVCDVRGTRIVSGTRLSISGKAEGTGSGEWETYMVEVIMMP